MIKSDLARAATALRTVLAALGRAAPGNTPACATLTYGTSLLAEKAEGQIAGAAVGSDIETCFLLAVQAGATAQAILSVYETAAAVPTSAGKPDRIVMAICKAAAVIALSRIACAATYTSRDDVDEALAALTTRFAVVESAAGGARQVALYRALIGLRAATTSYLTDASYPLPRQVTYQVGRTLSALTLAQRLYGTAERARELAQENRVFHPAFMPVAGRALSA